MLVTLHGSSADRSRIRGDMDMFREGRDMIDGDMNLIKGDMNMIRPTGTGSIRTGSRRHGHD